MLITICHLPFSMRARVGLLLCATALLALLRVGWLPAPWSPAIWPILGAMFMFRLMIYVYDQAHENEPFSWPRAFSYFFMLPNVCFPMYPVVDYKAFRRNYFDAEEHASYQQAIVWMTRGVVHLILYRLVYYYLTVAPTEIANSGDLLQFIVSNFLLYLRISGQFHLIIGLLRLFGFNLPETHHLYYLSSSFTDFWRRINIYWKDFMMKLFYYPVYFKLRAKGDLRAIVLSTLFVFFMTWVLHAYQWFWLRGTVLLSGPDALFWGILALFVVGNSLYEMKHGRERSVGKYRFQFVPFLRRALNTTGMFLLICVLWSLWSSETVEEWLALWETANKITVKTVGLLLAIVLVLSLGAEYSVYRDKQSKLKRPPATLFNRATVGNVVFLAALALAGIQEVYLHLGPQAATFVNTLRSGRLSRLDVAMMEKGYYENLNRVERFNSQLWELYMNRPSTWLDVAGTGLDRFTGDFLHRELVPSFVAMSSHGPVRTNRWGMRDQDYEAKPAPNTYRIALLGASSVMGWGVRDNETFEALVEERLNQNNVGKPYQRYEILNMAVPGYQPVQQLLVVEKAYSFAPNAVLYVATGREASRSASYLAEVTAKNIAVPFAPLREIIAKAAVPPKTAEAIGTRRLMPFRHEILTWTYRYIVDECRERGIVPLFLFLPQVEQGDWVEETPEILRIARAAGFVVADLSDVYQGHEINTLRIADWDNHPNANGHRLVAERLYTILKEHKDQRVAALFSKSTR
ncbi:MAG: hypothetical protein FJ145_14690 [Deltaproteobacteria bacterium]|nr:hypothetical protein [Deltaproteobacteria bacterium]